MQYGVFVGAQSNRLTASFNLTSRFFRFRILKMRLCMETQLSLKPKTGCDGRGVKRLYYTNEICPLCSEELTGSIIFVG